MKAFRNFLYALIFVSKAALAVDGVSFSTSDTAQSEAQAMDAAVAKYLKNLGTFLGYNLESPKAPDPNDTTLLNASFTQGLQQIGFNSVLGSRPVNAISQTIANFIPQNSANYAIINSLANYTFSSQNFSSASSQSQGNVSVIENIDQQQYQKDPVSQAVLNLLGTPNYTFCINNAGIYDGDCSNLNQSGGKVLNNFEVINNMLGQIPGPSDFFAYTSIEKYLSDLNSNSLIGPMLYSTSSGSGTTTSSSPTETNANGLNANSQAQQASNFIRYVSGLVEPLDLATKDAYNNLYFKAMAGGKSSQDIEKKKQAQAKLAKYLASLRVYAAQNSVAISNLYFILSKRLPQTQSSDGSVVTSDALNEFKMATWRLYNPKNKATNSQWINQINTASPATVQKEMAVLLAEINYQLYLSRQQQERILLNNAIQLVNNLNMVRPGQIPTS